MKLGNVARWADTTKLYDAYSTSPRHVMMAQVSSYIDNQQDGSISKRRPISFAPNQTVPPRRVVTYYGERWIVGDQLQDMWEGHVIRVSAACKKVTGGYRVLTPGEAALDSPGLMAYGQLTYLKDTVNSLTESAYSPQYEVQFAYGEPITARKVVKTDLGYLHIRSVYPVLDGFICAVSDDLGADARQAVTLRTRGAYDSATDTYATTNVSTFGIVLDYYKLYGKDTALEAAMQPGDLTLLVAASVATVVVGQTLALYGAEWKVLGLKTDADSNALHIRRT